MAPIGVAILGSGIFAKEGEQLPARALQQASGYTELTSYLP